VEEVEEVLPVRVLLKLGRVALVAGARTSFSWTLGRVKEGRCQCCAREAERDSDCGSRNCMLGGTDWEASRAIGPEGRAVTGTSISEAGVPRR
jgi:hypothetical protein